MDTTLSLPFDTYKLVSRFLDIGFTKPQSEALVETVHKLDTARAIHSQEIDDTKTDIKVMRSDITEIKQDLKNLQNLPYWFTGALFAQGGLIIAILQLLR